MSKTICGLDCGECGFKGNCGGCVETDGKPFGGECMVAACCKKSGKSSCGFSGGACDMKAKLIDEFNALDIVGMPKVTQLYALVGSYINLEYTLPGGQRAKFWDDSRVYMGAQLEKGGGRCYGLTADENFMLVCEYGENGSDASIVLFKKREL